MVISKRIEWANMENDTDELAQIIEFIGILKGGLPLGWRGWVNSLGLYVQLKSFSVGDNIIETLQAGGSLKSYFNAIREIHVGQDSPDWKIKNFNKTIWDERFSNLINPTFDIAEYLNGKKVTNTSPNFNEIKLRVDLFLKSGKWEQLPIS